MTRGVWRPGEPRSVDELLRQACAQARRRAEPEMSREPAGLPDPGERRERLERQAREAAYPQQHAGVVFRRIAVAAGVVAALGGLVVIGMTSESRPLSQGTLPATPLQPAIAPPTASSSPAPTSSPSPIPQTTVSTQTAPSASPSKLAPPPATVPPRAVERATCTVRYVIEDQWPTGFRTTVTITNTGGTPIAPWSLSWAYTAGQEVNRGWDGEYAQSGNRVTVAAASWNTAIAPGATVSTGFTGSLSGSNPAPAAYTLNGRNCTAD